MFKSYTDVVAAGLEMKVSLARKKVLTRVIKMTEPFECETMEGLVIGKAGDYLAIGAKNEVYPIDAEVFAVTYDLVTDVTE